MLIAVTYVNSLIKNKYIEKIRYKLNNKTLKTNELEDQIREIDEKIARLETEITEGTKKSGTPNCDVNLLKGDLKSDREIPNEDKYKLKKSKLLSVTNPKKAKDELEDLKKVVQYILRLHNLKVQMNKKLKQINGN